MKNLIIIGARSFGREVCNIAMQTKEYQTEWTIKGFLDSDLSVLDKFKQSYPPIIGSVEDYVPQKNDVFICALGDPKIKKEYVDKIVMKGGKFTNIIHPTAIICPIGVKIGKGVIICPYTYIGNDSTIGNYVTIQTHVALGHDVVVKNYCQINALSFLGGYVSVGECSTLNPSSNISPKRQVGSYAMVGINSAVLGKVPDGQAVFGNPAKNIL